SWIIDDYGEQRSRCLLLLQQHLILARDRISLIVHTLVICVMFLDIFISPAVSARVCQKLTR
ncbi:MAG: hypothetical protein AAFO76_14820, partial [Cyanobacteria bacterium J06607_15]